jgi:hypothetical protein
MLTDGASRCPAHPGLEDLVAWVDVVDDVSEIFGGWLINYVDDVDLVYLIDDLLG